MPGSPGILFLILLVFLVKCRTHCGACCIVPSISSVIPGMPAGKPAGVPCIHLTADWQCSIYMSPDRPDICRKFEADSDICGGSRAEAFSIMAGLEGLIINDSDVEFS